MAQIIQIHKDNLFHHPDNPRKDIGDITELAASIKEKGILQNLTVVPIPDEPGNYYIVIGNRRFEAGISAGLHEFPCVISEMDYATQLETMLIENMQRSDLTAFEEAKGFQQLMFEGFSVEDISKKTGFSQSTVRRRTQLADYNEVVVEQALGRGGTLDDFAKLNQIKDENKRSELAAAIGTNNFEWEYNRALRRQKVNEFVAKIKEYFTDEDTIILECDKGVYQIANELDLEYSIVSNRYSLDHCYSAEETDFGKFIEKINESGVRRENRLVISLPSEYGTYIYLYYLHEKETSDEPDRETSTQEEIKMQERERAIRENNNALDSLHTSCRNARFEFARKKFQSKLTKKEQETIICIAAKFLCYPDCAPNDYNGKEFLELTNSVVFGDDIDEGQYYRTTDDSEYEVTSDNAINLVFAQIYTRLDDNSYTERSYQSWSASEYAKPIKIDDDEYSNGYWKLLLELLEGLGYEPSDVEQQYYDGTHPLFVHEDE